MILGYTLRGLLAAAAGLLVARFASLALWEYFGMDRRVNALAGSHGGVS